LPEGTISTRGGYRLASVDAPDRIALPLHAAVEPPTVETLLEREPERPRILRLLAAGCQVVVEPRRRHVLLDVGPLRLGRACGDKPDDREGDDDTPPHWITRSARVSSDEGIARPSPFAAWRFTRSSKRVGRSTA